MLTEYAGNGRGYRTCNYPSCNKDHYSKRLCIDHYQAWYRERKRNGFEYVRVTWEELQAAVTDKATTCNLAICENNVHSRGLCQNHYVQYRRMAKKKGIK